MPYFQRRRQFKRPIRKRMFRRKRRFPVSRLPRRFGLNQYHFKRTVELSDFNASNVAPVSGAITFQLSDVPDATDFTNLFDCFCIAKVVINFCVRNITMVTSPYALLTPYLHTIIDKDDSSAPGSLTDMEQFQSYRKRPATKPVKRVLVPRLQVALYKTALTTAYGTTNRRIWVDCGDSATPHYGVKYWLDQTTNANAAFTYTPTVTYYLVFKDVR